MMVQTLLSVSSTICLIYKKYALIDSMNERPRNDREYLQLSPTETDELIMRAVIDGEMVDVDYADVQSLELSKPHAYIVEVDTENIQTHKDNQGIFAEEITKATLEYNDARLLRIGGPILPAKIAITVESQILSEINPMVLYEKDAIYTLMLDARSQWEVTESYSEGERSLNADLAAGERALSNDPRPLLHEELSLLRLFL